MSDEAASGTGEPILIVDDEKNIRRTVRMVLESEGHAVHEAGSIAEAEAVLAREPIDVVMLDVKLGDDNGLDLLRSLKSRGEDGMSSRTSEIPVVMISGHATIEDAVSATRLGAFDFMEKPLDRNRVMVTVRNALERRKMWREVHDLRRAVDARWELLGNTPVMADLRRQIAKVAPTRSTDVPRLPAMNDGARQPLPPLSLSQPKRAIDLRPVYVGLGLVVLAALFWWNRRRRAHLEGKRK